MACGGGSLMRQFVLRLEIYAEQGINELIYMDYTLQFWNKINYN